MLANLNQFLKLISYKSFDSPGGGQKTSGAQQGAPL
jgi:hypothetical protein